MTDKTQPTAHACINPQCNPAKCTDCACAIPANDQTGHVVLDLLNTFAVNDLGHPFEDGDSAAVDRARQWLQNRSTTLQDAPPAPAAVVVPAQAHDCCNSWFVSLSEGRQAALRDDKWMLAHAAFDAGRAALAAAPASASDTESVLIDGIAYEVPAAVAGELLSLHLDLLAAAPAQAVAVQEVADAQIDWDELQEDAGERAMFDRNLDLYGGDPRVAIATALRIWANTRGNGSFGAQCAVMANEVAKLHLAAAPAQSLPPSTNLRPHLEWALRRISTSLGEGEHFAAAQRALDEAAAAPAQAEAVPQESRFDASERMGQEARKALLLDPCKNTPELDAAIAGYLKATAPAQQHATQLAGQGQDDLRTAALQDSAYAAGMLSGWNFCVADDHATFSKVRGERMTAVRALKEARAAAPAQAQEVARDGLTQAARDVLAERARQVDAEGFKHARDDKYVGLQLAGAAASYLILAAGGREDDARAFWPWQQEWLKPSEQRRYLEKAGALVLAELERLDRASARAAQGGA